MDGKVSEIVIGFLNSDLVFEPHKSIQKGELIEEEIQALKDELTMLGTNTYSILVVFLFENGAVNTFSEMCFSKLVDRSCPGTMEEV